MDQSTSRNTEKLDKSKSTDRVTRQAALWATVVALPLALLAGAFVFVQFGPDEPAAAPTPSASTPRPQSTVPVEMAAAPLAERPATVCRALLSKLPAELRDLPQRPVTAGAEQNAAYGDPAITLACGVPVPKFCTDPADPTACYPLTDEVLGINGVCWHPIQQSDAVELTTVDREVPVRVNVPRAYEPPAQWLSEISNVVADSVPPATSGVPSGCTG